MSLPPEILNMARQANHDANATRYLSAVGLVCLLYDHALTFTDEVELVWKAKPSFAKRLFLFNRYLVAGCLLTVAYYMNHFSGAPISHSCQRIFGVSSLLGVSSIGTANVLVLLRVVTLWDRDRKIMILLTIGFLVSFLATFSLMVTVICTLLPNVTYSDYARICYAQENSPILVGVWASPMLFELLVLICVCWNAIDRPRSSTTPLVRVLQRDGITFFIALTTLRIFNMVMAAVARPTLVLVGVFFVWAMTTLVLNRSVLDIQRAGSAQATGSNGEDRFELGKVSSSGPDQIPESPKSFMSSSQQYLDPYSTIHPLQSDSGSRFLSPLTMPTRSRSRDGLGLSFGSKRSQTTDPRSEDGKSPRTSDVYNEFLQPPLRYNISPSALVRPSSAMSRSDDGYGDGYDCKMHLSDSECGYGLDDFKVAEQTKPKRFWRR